MNILIINPILYTPPPQGSIVQRISTIKHTMIYNYCLGFITAGHSITLIASEEYRPIEDTDFEFDIIFLKNTLKERIKKFPNGFPYLSGLYKYLKNNKEQFDIVISSENFTYNSLIAAIVCPQKLIIWQEVGQHAPTLNKIPSKIWHNIIARILYKNVLIVPRSDRATIFINQYCRMVSDDIVDHGININNFRFCADKQKYFVVVAQLIKRKNISLTIDKFKAFCRKYGDDYHLYIAGQGEEYDNLTRKIKDEGLIQNVTLKGFLSKEELSDLVGSASCSMLDSSHDYNIVSVLESIVCGTPFITNTVPYSSSLINNRHLGIAKDNWNEDDINNVLHNLPDIIEHCKMQREYFDNTYLATKIVNIFIKHNGSKE